MRTITWTRVIRELKTTSQQTKRNLSRRKLSVVQNLHGVACEMDEDDSGLVEDDLLLLSDAIEGRSFVYGPLS